MRAATIVQSILIAAVAALAPLAPAGVGVYQPGDIIFVGSTTGGPRLYLWSAQTNSVTTIAGTITTGAVGLPPVTLLDNQTSVARTHIATSDGVREMTLFSGFAAEFGPLIGAGAAFADVSNFRDPLAAFEDPLIAFEDPLVAFEDPLIAFEDPLIAFEDPLIAFEDPLIAFTGSQLRVFNRANLAAPTQTFSMPGTVHAVAALPRGMANRLAGPGAWFTSPVMVAAGADLLLVDLAGGPHLSLLAPGEALSGVRALIPAPTGGQVVAFVLELAPGVAAGSPMPRVRRVYADGSMDVLSEGAPLTDPRDMAMDLNGNLIVADFAAGGGALIRIHPIIGGQTAFAVADGVNFSRHRGVSVVRCRARVFDVNTSADFPDPNPGDGVPGFPGNTSLRSAIQEAQALGPCGGAIIRVPAGVFFLNHDDGDGPDLDITSGWIRIVGQGMDQTFIDGASATRVFDVNLQGRLALRNLTVRNGQEPAISGAGVSVRHADARAALMSVAVRQCSTSFGAGVANRGRMYIGDSIIAENAATADFGGIWQVDQGSSPRLTMTRSTVHNNSAAGGGGGVNFGAGGGLPGGEGLIINSTIANNSAQTGGGMLIQRSAVTIDSCTIAFNSAGATGGGGIRRSLPELPPVIRNTIVAQNLSPSGPDVLGDVESAGFNLFGSDAGLVVLGDMTGVQINANAHLLPLAPAPGSALPVLAMLPYSAALDAGAPAGFQAIDQRRRARPIDGDRDGDARADIGAYEFAPAPCAGDVDGDGDVDFADLNLLLSSYNRSLGEPGFDWRADFNLDQSVGFPDLNTLLGAFNSACG